MFGISITEIRKKVTEKEVELRKEVKEIDALMGQLYPEEETSFEKMLFNGNGNGKKLSLKEIQETHEKAIRTACQVSLLAGIVKHIGVRQGIIGGNNGEPKFKDATAH